MKIGVNCLSIKPKYFGGVTTYALGLLNGFREIECRHSFQIYVTAENKHLFKGFENVSNINIIVCDKFNFWRFSLSRFSAISGSVFVYNLTNKIIFSKTTKLMEMNSDLIYSPVPVAIPHVKNIPVVLSPHDIQHIHFPEYFDYFTLRYKYVSYLASITLASHIQASSQYMKTDFLDNYKSINDNIFVIPEGVDIKVFSSATNVDVVNKYNLPDKFIFFPAQLWLHKNHITVLKALNNLNKNKDEKIALVLTGGKFTAGKLVLDYIEQNNMDYVYYLGLVPFDDLIALYHSAKFLITAVLYESSSLPVLEAAAAGTPIIASDTLPNKELSDNFDINLFKVNSYDSLSDLIIKIWDDVSLHDKQINHNKNIIINYSWECIANKYIAEFERIN